MPSEHRSVSSIQINLKNIQDHLYTIYCKINTFQTSLCVYTQYSQALHTIHSIFSTSIIYLKQTVKFSIQRANYPSVNSQVHRKGDFWPGGKIRYHLQLGSLNDHISPLFTAKCLLLYFSILLHRFSTDPDVSGVRSTPIL